VVAETDDEAMKIGERYMMWLFARGLKVRPEFNFPPGYVSEASYLATIQAGLQALPARPTFKDLVDAGIVIAGGVDTVIEKLSYYAEELHAGILVDLAQVGEMPSYLVLQHLELMAKQVMPHFRPQPTSTEPAPVELHTTH
jgi:alkanesulfonate monooxygenase SsuD/methylene tetrahydromethanopterin reductase-like flavin-dependent oxidoreductase (luciferase family)